MSASFYELLKYAKTGIASPEMTAYDKMRALSMAGGAIKMLTGVPPLTFKADGNPLISWSMLGNSQQNGTPAPDAPIMPTFCGERTGNLYNSSETDWELGILDDNGNPTGSTTSHYTKNFTAVEPETAYYLSGTIYIGQSSHRIYYYDTNKNWISRSPLLGYYDGNFTTPANCKYVQIQTIVDLESTSDWMLNTGSAALPYEPYGYKLPITNAGQTQNVYLGEVQTVRRIRKLVLTGDEIFTYAPSTIDPGSMCFALKFADAGTTDIMDYNKAMFMIPYPRFMCSHFKMKAAPSGYVNYTDMYNGEIGANSILVNPDTFNRYFIFCSDQFTTNADFKSYLAQQYAAGTPVVIWYILATPTTSIVNEPLCKIGDYADTLDSADAGITIPTTRGSNTLTVDTELQPSEMTITYRG